MSAPHSTEPLATGPEDSGVASERVKRPIRVLDPQLANQIAAGEVVERPASVVKELIENALDAGAQRVEVSIVQGGLELIEVRDDGHGLSPSEARLALERHATSKLREFRDLDELVSYGFRGEALPSIASVSRFTLRTRTQEAESGVELELEGGRIGAERPAGLPVGTQVLVADLFFNVPARRKFLRSSGTEAGHVSDVLTGAALARPDVAFSLKRDGRVVRSYQRATSRAERVLQVLEGEELHAVSGERGPLVVHAFLSSPARARSGTAGLDILMNGRPIRDRGVAATLAHAYGGALERGRYPRGVVYLELSPRLVDVNVHPQKTEVRFADPRAVSDALHGIVSRGLRAWLDAPTASGDEAPSNARATPSSPPSASSGHAASSTRAPASPSIPRRDAWSRSERPWFVRDGHAPSANSASFSSGSTARSADARLSLLGQAGGRCFVVETTRGVLLLDQEAVSERVAFGRLTAARRAGTLTARALLFPMPLELTTTQVNKLEESAELASTLGLDVRVRTETAVAIHGVPSVLERAEATRVLEHFLGALREPGHALVDVEARFFRLVARDEVLGWGERIELESARKMLDEWAAFVGDALETDAAVLHFEAWSSRRS